MEAGRRRLVLAALIAALLVGTLLHYGALAEQRELTDRSAALVESSQPHAGESVYVWAFVTAVDEGTLTVHLGDVEATVVDVEAAAERGDLIQVAGTLRGDDVIAAERVVVSEHANRLRMFGVSIAGFVLVVASFVRYWRVNARELTVEAR